MRMHRLVAILLALILVQIHSQTITAELILLTYEPLRLNLKFSEKLPLPNFELLFNQIKINYTLIDYKGPSNSFIFQGVYKGIVEPSQFNTDKYVLIFREPLKIGDGRLGLNSFFLRAKKSKTYEFYTQEGLNRQIYYKYQSYSEVLNSLAIAIVSIVYFLAYTTLIGIHAYNFLTIFMFISLRSPLFTALDYRCAHFLLFEVGQVDQSMIRRDIYMILPHILIALSFVIGLISRFTLSKLVNKSGLYKEIYFYLSYKFFIITWQIMCIPMLANVSHIIVYQVKFGNAITNGWAILYIYLSIVLLVSYSYMAYFTVNPQISQTPNKWSEYIKSSHFQLFDGFHLGIDANNWKKRNFTFIISLMRNIIIIFVACQFVNVPNLLIQIFYLIYLFTLRPFKQNFFNYIIIGIQTFVIVFYLYRYIVELYIGISDQIITSSNIAAILLTNIIFLCIITFAYFVLGTYQFYQRVKAFRYNIYGWVEEVRKNQEAEPLTSSNRSEYTKEISFYNESETPVRRNYKKGSGNQQLSPYRSGSGSPKKSPRLKNGLKNLSSSSKTKSQIQSRQTPEPSERMESPGRDKSPKKPKQKSSLLQTISMGGNS